MNIASRVRPSLALTAMLAGLLAASCASEAPPAPLPPAPIPPAAPPPPPVALSKDLVDAAGVYRAYIRRVSTISPAFPNGPAVEQSLVVAAAYEPKQFLKGMIAYAALVALQDSNFVAGVRTYGVDPVQRKSMAARLAADPNYAAAMPGAASAAGLVVNALNADGAKVRDVGNRVKQAAYDVQHQDWSKAAVPNAPARLAQAKALSASPLLPPEEETKILAEAVRGSEAKGAPLIMGSGAPVTPPFTGVVSRGLAIAAIAALGEGGEGGTALVQGLNEDTTGGFCLNLAKLNLYQCLSVAKPYYEDVFCLGQHILIDTGQCLAKVAGSPPLATAAAATPVATK
ncbi:MAG: hypothetical protein ABIO39_12670 [Caulobacteraceae bacterium]